MNRKPNILIFNVDQFRADALGHLGNPAAVTPNLDQLAETEAVSFRNAFCQNPVCVPSRCSFMTGWYPHVMGHRTQHYLMHESDPVLLKTMKDNGYFVWWAGRNDLIPPQVSIEQFCTIHSTASARKIRPGLHADQSWRGKKGTDNFYSFYAGRLDKGDEDIYFDSDWNNVYQAIDFIKNSRSVRPFCIFLGLLYPHPPYGVEEPWYSMIKRDAILPLIPQPETWKGKPGILKGLYDAQGLKNWEADRLIELRATYLGMCARVDHQFGMVIDALKETGCYNDTAIFFFSDHGDFTGDYGLVEKTQNTFEDCLTHVPFLIKPPAEVPVKSRISNALIELVDFPATVQALTGIEFNYTHFGRSLLSIVSGKTDEHRDAVFCEGGRLHGEIHCMGHEDNGGPDDLYYPRTRLQISEGPEHTKAIMCRTKNYKYVRRLYEDNELYDLKKDPDELHNLIRDRDYINVALELERRLLTFYLETCDTVPHKTDQRS
ncbi:MAG: arylsulfatase [Spirochaetes bacterium GWF1_41_5]|nr:MAG: arylsulfatase [Spirochaetes bacterium GWF1_41_5]HBE03087.1 arylsulfatase [Spirochaetia bacterium]